jgi:hypothetical protein
MYEWMCSRLWKLESSKASGTFEIKALEKGFDLKSAIIGQDSN